MGVFLVHWYKRDPDAALAGMAELSAQERGVYNSLIDLLYARDGDVPDDDRRIARMISLDVREYRAVKQRLIARHKVWIEDGKITAKRVRSALDEAQLLSKSQRTKAQLRWHKSEKLNDINAASMPHGNASTTTTTTTKKEEDSSLRSNANGNGQDPYAFESGVIRLTEKSLNQWKQAFPYLSLEAELIGLADWAGLQKKWFPAVSGALAKRNREEKRAREIRKTKPEFNWKDAL